MAQALDGIPGLEVCRDGDGGWRVRPCDRREQHARLVVTIDGEVVLDAAGRPPWNLPDRELTPVRSVELVTRRDPKHGAASRAVDVRTRRVA